MSGSKYHPASPLTVLCSWCCAHGDVTVSLPDCMGTRPQNQLFAYLHAQLSIVSDAGCHVDDAFHLREVNLGQAGESAELFHEQGS